MAYENLNVEKAAPGVAITLNRPKANAISKELIQELGQAVREAEQDPEIRAIIITGGDSKFFAAGADIPTLQQSLDDPFAEGGLLSEGLKTIDAIEKCSKPVIALVNGYALGGGCELCLACHIRIAVDTALFGQPEINLGIIPGWGGTHRLARLIGTARAYDWLVTGRNVTADEALAAGLVSQVVPPEKAKETVQELVKTIAGKPPAATAETLAILRGAAVEPGQGAALEAESFKRVAQTKDAREGISAFLEKRNPNFTGE